MMTMPARQRSRHALAALRSDGSGCVRVAISPLSTSHQPTNRLEVLRIDGTRDAIIEGSAKAFLSALGGTNLCHYDQPELVDLVDAALRKRDLAAIDNPVIDLSGLAEKAFARRDLGQARLTLDELSARHGTPKELAQASRTCPVATISILGGLFQPFFLPEIAKTRGAYAPNGKPGAFHLAPDDIFALAGGAIEPPELPELVPPDANGWRRGPWDGDEALDCALRFCRGATLADLSRLTRRSPRAIRARLALDGILARPATP